MLSDDRITLRVAVAAVSATLLVFLLSQYNFPSPADTALNIDMHVAERTVRASSLDLRQRTNAYRPFDGELFTSTADFVYLWITVHNPNEAAREVLFTNTEVNYYTELLHPHPLGALSKYRYGDRVSLANVPIRDMRAVFPLHIPARETRDFIVEYHGMRVVTVNPQFMSVQEYVNQRTIERGILGGITGAVLILICIAMVAAVLQQRRALYGVAFFAAAVFFFFLRQSRLLLLYADPLIYPHWLFPLSILLNQLGAAALLFGLLGGYMQRGERYVLSATVIVVIFLAMISFAAVPMLIADVLNMLSFVFLTVTAVAFVRALRSGDREPVWIALSFLPWITMMILDILGELSSTREYGFMQYRQVFGLTAHLMLLLTVLLYSGERRARDRIAAAVAAADGARAEYYKKIQEIGTLRTAMLQDVGFKLRRNVESVIASSRILLQDYNDPRVTAAGQVIQEEALILKRQIDSAVGCLDWDDDIINCQEYLENLPQLSDDASAAHPARIWVLDSNSENAAHTKLLLKAEGLQAVIADDQYQILQAASQGGTDVVIIDPTSVGEVAFTLCRMLRSDFNMLQLPILMMTSYHADYLLQQGYAVGVNDFVTRPFDASELTTRVQSLLRLREVARHNKDLARAEHEKNAFLFFLTHNINTPLTVLLNRVRDLQELVTLDDLSAIGEDLESSSREIHDVVQNVLVSFRLADGRQTTRMGMVEIDAVIHSITRDLQGKANAKRQQLVFDVPEACPEVYGDFTSLRGIIYNLVDNAIKFSPVKGSITLQVLGEESVRIVVKDSGPGIPASDRGRMFQRFGKLTGRPTAGESSTGLGLYVAYELAILNSGNLVYEPQEVGACFVLSLQPYSEDYVNV